MRSTLFWCLLLPLLFALDASGGAAGPLFKEQFHVTGTVNVTVPLPNGQVLIGGNFDSVNGVRQPHVARLNADGSLDGSWRPQLSLGVRQMVVSGDEVYLLDANIFRSFIRRAKLSDDGQIDPAWAVSLSDPQSGFLLGHDIAISSGFVYLLATDRPFSSRSKLVLTRYFRAGSGEQDHSWTRKIVQARGDQGLVVAKIFVDERHVYAGHGVYTDRISGPTYIDRYRVSGSGARDRRWRAVVKHPAGGVLAFAQDDNFVYLAGDEMKVGRAHAVSAARFSKQTAKCDLQWPSEQVAFETTLTDIAVSSGTAFLLTPGGLTAIPTGPENSTGLPSYALSQPDNIYQSLAAMNGAVYLMTNTGATLDRILRVDPVSGIQDQTFRPRIYAEATIKQVLRLANGTTFVAGRFDAVGDVLLKDLARFEPDGSLNTAWAPSISTIFGAAQILVSGDSLYVSGLSAVAKVSLATPARVDPVWNPREKLDTNLPADQISGLSGVELSEAGVFLLYDRLDNKTFDTLSFRLHRIPLEGNGTPDPGWNVNLKNAGANYRSLKVHQGFLYAGGSFSSFIDRYALLGNGARDTTWRSDVQPNTSLLGADHTYLYVADSSGLLRRYPLAGTGAADDGWNPRFKLQSSGGRVNSASKLGSYLYVSGNFDSVSEATHTNVARLTASGAADPDFNPNVPFLEGSSGPLWVGALGENPVLGGAFDEIDATPAFSPALFNSLAPPTLTRSGTKVFAELPDAEALGVKFFRVTSLQGGTLATSEAVALAAGDFITVAQARAGLDFMPDPGFEGPRSLALASALAVTEGDTGATSSTIDLTNTLPPRNRYTMAASAITVREGAPAAIISVQKIGPEPGGVTFLLEEGVARLGRHFSAPPGLTLDFAAGDGAASITVPLMDDLVFTGNKDFRVVLTGTTDNGIILSPEATQVTIADDDPIGDTQSLTARPALVAPPAGSATLTVNFNALLGAWRLLGETNWHGTGETLAGLTRGNYFVEFRIANGFIAPPARTVPVDFGEQVTVDGNYFALGTVAMGALSVSIEPASVANAAGPARGQWQLVGETAWRDSGDTVEGLPSGPYDIVFKDVSGRQSPPPQTVNVAGSVLYTVSGTYLIAQTVTGAQPQPVDFATQQTAPYGFVGQIRTPAGLASGTAVRSRVVLTVAHAVFDDATLSSVTDARWYYQKARGNFEPPPQGARGWYIFEGYAGQRAVDLASGAGGVGISSPESQQLDVAAMWFLEPCARGSYSGYLRTDADNDWLRAARRRILAGYPIVGVPLAQRGTLQATDASIPSTFTALNPTIRATEELSGAGGMSGGPLFVEENGGFFPAGVFLGGTAQCLVRVIDEQVVDLINRGEVSGNGGDNNVGGGVTLVAPGITSSPFSATLLGCNLSPAGAIAQGAAWRLAGEQAYRASGTRVSVIPGTYRLEFKPVPGFVAPESQVVNLVAGQVATARNGYVPGVRITALSSPPEAGSAPSRDFPLGVRASITARPGPDFLFSAWMEGDQIIGRSATLSFEVTGPREFTAVFVAGSFLPFTGKYAGFHESAGTLDGLAAFSVTGSGSFSGKVTYRGKTYTVRGALNDDGTFSGALGPYPLLLTLDRTSPVGVLTGQVFDGGTPTVFTTTQSPYGTNTNTPLAGTYTLLLPSEDPADVSRPPGTGIASVTVTAEGAVMFAGTLADGVPISGGSALVDGDLWPCYAATFGGAGRLVGKLRFRQASGISDADGMMEWRRPPSRSDRLYPSGFETQMPAIGSRYLAPPVDYAAATLRLDGGDFGTNFTRPLTVRTSSLTVTSPADRSVSLEFNRKTGLFAGKVTSPTTGKQVQLGGAVFQITRSAKGFLRGRPPTTGALEINPAP